jgi:hypothetical protein
MLCRTLGNGRWSHPDAMLAEMTVAEFEDWQTIYGIDPWGEERDDLRMARIVWAALRPHYKRSIRERDFVLKFSTSREADAAQYRQRAHQRYGMIAAAMERQEQRALPAPGETSHG